jgi:hypothetical protein
MKSLKTLLSVFAIAAFLTATATAQEQSTVTATTLVQADLTVTTATNIDLGTIQTGETSTIKANANDGATEANLGTSATAGQVDVSGTASASVTVNFTNATLDNGSDPLTFTTVVYSGSTAVSDGDSISLDSDGVAQLDIGGSLAAPGETGTYDTGTGFGSPITVTITYD